MNTREFEAAIDAAWGDDERAKQYRTSFDGIVWTEWKPLPDVGAKYPWAPYIQVRIDLGDGAWRLSQIMTWDRDDGG